jgi:hypothetical protein
MRNSNTWVRGVLLAICFGMTACGGDDDGDGGEAEGAFTLWRSKAPPAYTFIHERGCYCPRDYTAPVRVVVENGQVTSARFADGADAPSERVVTIDDLHRDIDRWLDRQPAHFEAEFDETWGYPRSAQVDESRSIADDEYMLSVTCFAPDASADSCPLEPAD